MRKNNILILILITSLFLVSSCTKEIPEDKEQIKGGCISDSDCVVAGCSGQLCVQESQAKDIITTCEYKDEYECLKLSSCSCIDNKCQWKENKEYLSCIENTK